MLVAVMFQCGRQTGGDTDAEQTYVNLSDTVKYVGIETCRKCHYQKHQTFVHTGMGSSFGVADTAKSVARISDTTIIYDPHSNFYYQPYWKGDSLFLKEFRLGANGDTTYRQNRKIDYVVGSGQHTNSHLFVHASMLYQAPFTWYAQKSKADLPPGYEGGYNSRFTRQIGLECTSCHNAMPTGFVPGSINKYTEVPGAIDCERCHGPGEIHVQRMMKGQYVDTATAIDYSIVNPKKLPVSLQFEICQRCHLQGNAVLVEDRSFMDFKPGMRLSEVMDIYLPRYSNADNRFIMASHVDRFKLSECFKNSEGYNCASCHNPHISVRETNVQKFNQQCRSCHQEKDSDFCTAKKELLQSKNFNCVECHMPSSGAVDIPHVTVHDHYVRKPDGSRDDTTGISRFLGLVAVNNAKPDLRSRAMAYMQQYERFNSYPYYLDSALVFLNKLDPQKNNTGLWTYYFFLKQDFGALTKLVNSQGTQRILGELKTPSLSNEQAWTAYRIGESFYKLGNINEAWPFYKRAVDLAPYVPDFQNKAGVTLLVLQKPKEALRYFDRTLELKADHQEALNNKGYVRLLQGEFQTAKKLFQKALTYDPDYELAWLNLANAHLQLNENTELRHCLKEVLRINPVNKRAQQLLNTIGGA